MIGLIRNLAESLRYRRDTGSSEKFVDYLRRKGIEVGRNTVFFEPRTITIDVTKPSLITIGNDVRIAKGVVILTHGADWHILREMHHRSLGSAGRVAIIKTTSS